jgi:hypothetical protein
MANAKAKIIWMGITKFRQVALSHHHKNLYQDDNLEVMQLGKTTLQFAHEVQLHCLESHARPNDSATDGINGIKTNSFCP